MGHNEEGVLCLILRYRALRLRLTRQSLYIRDRLSGHLVDREIRRSKNCPVEIVYAVFRRANQAHSRSKCVDPVGI